MLLIPIRTALTVTAATILTVGCASKPSEIQAQYVSPMTYSDRSCKQIRSEMRRVQSKVTNLGGQIADNASGDNVAMGVGMLLFWPALFFLDGDGTEAQDYGRLKGEYEALEEAALQENCN